MQTSLIFVLSEGCILSASTKGTDNTISQGRGKKGGIVPGHAYTILSVYSPRLTLKTGIRLVKLRNPWGSFEWTGDWSDKSELWKKHPQIKLEMGEFFPSPSQVCFSSPSFTSNSPPDMVRKKMVSSTCRGMIFSSILTV